MALGQEVASFYAAIGADTSGLERGLDSARAGLDNLKTGFGQLEKFVTTSMLAIGAAVAGSAAAVAVTGFQFNAMKEQSQIAFTTMLGSSEAAQAKLEELQAFAAKTPFEFPDLIRASQRMMAMGFAAEDVIPTLTAIGDAVAALGGGQFEIDRVTTALGQMNAKGKTSAEEMMQLTEAGIPAWQMLADKIGVTVPEAMKMVTKGAVDAQTTISAVTEGIEQRFGGMMAAQSQTFTGLLSNLKDNFTQLSGTVMQPFFEMAKSGLAKVVEITSSPQFIQGIKDFAVWGKQAAQQIAAFVQQGIEWGQNVLPPLWEKLQQVVTAIKLLATPITDAIGKFVGWKDVATALGVIVVGILGNIVVAFAPVITTIAAVTVAVAALRQAWENDFMGIRTFTLNTIKKITDWFYDSSGIWKGTWEETLEYLAWWASGGWKNYVYFPIRTRLFELVWEFEDWKKRIIYYINEWKDKTIETVQSWVEKGKHLFFSFINDTQAKYVWWRDYLIDVVDDFVDINMTKFTTWKNNTVALFKEWGEKVIKFFQPILDWWSEHIQPFVEKGRQLVQGLWDGVRDKWTEFSTWVRHKWEDLKDSFSNAFGIHSPSTVFEDYGKNIVIGLTRGIDGAQGMVFGAMDNLSAGMSTNMDYSYAASGQPATSTTRIEDLLEILIAELRAKNMTINVAGGGGYGSGGAAGFVAGGRRY